MDLALQLILRWWQGFFSQFIYLARFSILGDPGADSGGEGKSKRAGKYGTKKKKERREESLGIMTYQTSSKRSPPFCLLIGQKNTKVFWHQSEGRTTATVWNWSGKTLSPGALLAVLFFFVPYFLARLDFPSSPLSAPRSPRMQFFKRVITLSMG